MEMYLKIVLPTAQCREQWTLLIPSLIDYTVCVSLQRWCVTSSFQTLDGRRDLLRKRKTWGQCVFKTSLASGWHITFRNNLHLCAIPLRVFALHPHCIGVIYTEDTGNMSHFLKLPFFSPVTFYASVQKGHSGTPLDGTWSCFINYQCSHKVHRKPPLKPAVAESNKQQHVQENCFCSWDNRRGGALVAQLVQRPPCEQRSCPRCSLPVFKADLCPSAVCHPLFLSHPFSAFYHVSSTTGQSMRAPGRWSVPLCPHQ